MISQETVEVLWKLKTLMLALAQQSPEMAEGLCMAAALVQDEIDQRP
jgi:hypothetical protein